MSPEQNLTYIVLTESGGRFKVRARDIVDATVQSRHSLPCRGEFGHWEMLHIASDPAKVTCPECKALLLSALSEKPS